MSRETRLRRTVHYIQTHWPVYFGLYGLLIATVLFMGLSLALGWFSFVPFSLALVLVVSYFLISLLYVAYLLNDAAGGAVEDFLFDLGQTRPEDRVVCIDLGLKSTAVSLARHLTTGEVIVIDIYNPQSNPSAALRRGRDAAPKPPPDPRLNWIDGSIDLLPLPDRSVRAVYMNQILSEFWLDEERTQLLEEVRRILVPEGRLLVAERVRASNHLLLAGLTTYSLPAKADWREMLIRAGFIVRRQEDVRGVIYCARVDKPLPTSAKQMQLKLEYI